MHYDLGTHLNSAKTILCTKKKKSIMYVLYIRCHIATFPNSNLQTKYTAVAYKHHAVFIIGHTKFCPLGTLQNPG